MQTIRQTYYIKAPIDKVWDALVNPETIDKWGGGPAQMSEQEEAQFSLWGGDIHGKNKKVVRPKVLVQEWMAGTWPDWSKVTFELYEQEGETVLELTHENVPDEAAREIDRGWKNDYLWPLKELVEK